jgi:hypothetical protein
LALSLLLAAARGHAQVPAPPPPDTPPLPQAPQPGFVPPYEITHTVRLAGFDPLAPPLREGTTYVLRATDFRGILMRVVVDARTGAIRDVTRIVPAGPGTSSQIGLGPQPYGLPSRYDDAPPYGVPVYGEPPIMPDQEPQLVRPQVAHPATHPNLLPPLPRPRPATLAARKPADDAKTDAKTEIKSDVTTAAPPITPKPEVTNAAPPAAAPKPSKAAPSPPISD